MRLVVFVFLITACVRRPTGLELRAAGAQRHVPDTRVRAEPQVNFGRNVQWHPTYAFRPTADVDSLVAALKWVDASLPPTTRVKAGGSRHSFSPTAATGGVYLHPEGMRFITQRSDTLFEVGAGTTLRELNLELWSRGKALAVLGGYDGQTLGGAFATGTHGSMLTQGALADALVRQVNLVTADGRMLRFEPTAGVDLPPSTGWETRRDDLQFAAAKTNLGTLGVVHSYLVEVVPRFWLQEVRTRTDLNTVRAVLEGGNLYRLMQHDGAQTAPTRTFDARHPTPAHHLELLWNVHTGLIVVTTRDPVAVTGDEPTAFTDPPGRNLFRVLATDETNSRPRAMAWSTESVGTLLSGTNELIERVATSATPAVLDAAMSALSHQRYLNRSYTVFNVGDGTNAMPHLFGTISVPLANDTYLRAIDIIEKVAADRAAHGQYEDGPIALRFKKGLSPPQGSLLGDAEDTCQFEFIFSGTDTRSRTEAMAFMEAYDRALFTALGPQVKLHFGHLYPYESQNPVRTAAAYPGLAAFNQLRASLDPHRRFTNAFQARLLGD